MTLYLFACPLLLAAAYCDLRYMRIPNLISLILLLAFVVTAVIHPMPDLAIRVVAAATVFVLGFCAFAFRLFGGGDVKLLATLMLYVPAQGLSLFAYVFAGALLVGIAFVVLARMVPWWHPSGWRFLSGKHDFPMGISIALAGLVMPLAIPL